MSEKKVLKLGTRRSLLAQAQSRWVARKLEALEPGLRVELVGIETQGDRIQDVPLSKIEGKEFFVAELDRALLSKKVDLTVHSMKDLSLERPEGIQLAAIPPRENPRDIAFFHPRTLEKIRAGTSVRIGTSALRRLENAPAFFRAALPRFEKEKIPLLEWEEIRGNVNTRLSRLHETGSRSIDGVILALSGLIRLSNDEAGQRELQKLLKNLRPMLLPLKECPSAPAQGALAIECRKEDAETFQVLQKLHDPKTEKNVTLEREVLAESGGGCHQRFGATAIDQEGLGPCLYIRGKNHRGEPLNELRWKAPEKNQSSNLRAWNGSRHRTDIFDPTLFETADLYLSGAVFVAHSRAVLDSIHLGGAEVDIENARVWTSGTPSWFRLAKKGIWVEGCAEMKGFSSLWPTLKLPLFRLPALENWTILTHESAIPGWADSGANALPTYRLKKSKTLEKMREKVERSTHFYWGSGSQYDLLSHWVPSDSHHACGPGKTAHHLKEKGVKKLQIFPNAEEWEKWLKSA